MPNVYEAFAHLPDMAVKGSVCHPLAFSLGKGGLKLSLMN
ncbi:hypothetical protein SAMN05421866_0663 [Chryseobacterium oranimense]|jgi:hypothetical protein|uniref:Uncharacterized protein n=1 Tax=Chryseobacterium oranimense TaxID=421058 RepID=A0A1M5KDK3_9FLAO|nr:hypothetical protein [Chryseobacterium koreense]SHG50882.1 hypothetical protein SAMN05421866_0663 [Chryseobacterium oranimense]SUJ03020.1 Uncharacterised protein [Sphingobacterium spiritivorum]